MVSDQRDPVERLRATGPLVIGGAVSLGLFLVAIQLLGTATGAAADPLRDAFARYGVGHARALGGGWLGAYVITNGSTVAAIAVSLFHASVVTGEQFFLLVAGSRLGAAGVVVLVGALDYLQKKRYTLGQATRLGLLTFLLTYTIYLPATLLGFLGLPMLPLGRQGGGWPVEVSFQPTAALEPATAAVVQTIGAGPAFGLAVGLLFASLTLFNRVLERVDTTWLRQRFFTRFQHRWVAAGLGVLITAATTSIAFSLGVIVPLYNREYLRRREVVPYVLGANIGTFLDTILVGVVLDAPDAVTITLALVAIAAGLTLLVLALYEPYYRGVEAVQKRIITDRRALTGFLLSLVLAPVILVAVPL